MVIDFLIDLISLYNWVLTAREEGEATMEARLEVGTEKAQEELIEEAERGCETAHSAHEFLLCPINLNEDFKD